MDLESSRAISEAKYAAFVDCLIGNCTNRDPETQDRRDIRDEQFPALQEEIAFPFLKPYNFAAMFSNGLGIKRGPEAARVVDELAQLSGTALIVRVSALQEADQLPLMALPRHPAETAVSAVLSNPTVNPDGERIGYTIYRDCAVILKRAKRDPEVRRYIFVP